jgi:hypothetical protein
MMLDMIPVPINEAEAIFAPFFDNGNLLETFEVWSGAGCAARVEATWSGVDVVIDRAPVGVVALTLACRAPLAIAGYDVFRVFACQPPYVRLRITGTVDGGTVVILDSHVGDGGMQEIDGMLAGEWLDAFTLEFSLLESRPATMTLRWLGLANRAAQDRLEARPSPFAPDWPYCLAPDPTGPTPAPALGILFGGDELETLRERCLSGPLKPMTDILRRQALNFMQLEPERMVGYLVPAPDIRWTRVRDNWKPYLYHKMEPLALMGLIDRNPEFSRMAARMALAVAHCTHWCESPMGVHPGATWHHASFQETYYSAACALVLDWAGAWFTPRGRRVVEDAIVMKGLPRIESDFKRKEYIRSMNQGIVFSIGRILGLLALIPSHPRYASQLAEAERDLHEMIDAYILDDGVILEGPGYWAHTFLDVSPLYYVLARHHHRPLKDFASEKLRRTGDFALSLLSTLGAGTGYLGINDAHNLVGYPPNTAVAFSLMTDRPEWKRLLAAELAASAAPGHGGFGSGVDHFALVMAGCAGLDLAVPPPVTDHRFVVFPIGGQAASVRQDAALGAVHLHLCSGPTCPTHYDEDKGSIILEAAGQPLVIDRGVLAYHEAENAFLHCAAAHSLLYPEPRADGVPFVQPAWGEHAYGARLGECIEVDGLVLLASDNAGAWPDGLFETNLRRICSPAPTLFLIEDVIEAGQLLEMSFRLHTPQPAELLGREAWISAPGVSLRIAAVNWNPCVADVTECSIDDQHRPVNLVRMVSTQARSHRLLTVLELLPKGIKTSRWQFTVVADGLRAEQGNIMLSYVLSADGSACVRLRRGMTEGFFYGATDWEARP